MFESGSIHQPNQRSHFITLASLRSWEISPNCNTQINISLRSYYHIWNFTANTLKWFRSGSRPSGTWTKFSSQTLWLVINIYYQYNAWTFCLQIFKWMRLYPSPRFPHLLCYVLLFVSRGWWIGKKVRKISLLTSLEILLNERNFLLLKLSTISLYLAFRLIIFNRRPEESPL